jgi:hypothetical protein
LLYGNSSQGHTNAIKLSTKSYGIDVSGDINVTGAASSITFDSSNNSGKTFFIRGEGNGNATIENDDEMYVSSTHLYIQKPGGTTTMAEFIQDGAVKLNHNNSTKLQTTASGIDVTGRVETDTLNVSGISTFAGRVAVGTDATPNFSLDVQDTIQIRKNGGNNLAILQFNASSTKLHYSDATGNLSFYTNSTERGYWGYTGGFNVTSGGLNVTSGGLDVTGHTETDTLNVSGLSTFAGGLNVSGTSTFAGITNVTGGLNASGISTFQNLNIDNNSFPLVGILTGINIDDSFGGSLATNVDGTSVVVGEKFAPVNGNASAGYAYVYDRSGNTYSQVGILTAGDDIEAASFFGHTVAMSRDGSLIMVSAPYKDIGAISNAGKVYAFERSGNTFTRIGIITASDAATDYLFGDGQIEISDDKNYIAIGSPNTVIYGSDQLYIYKNTGGTFTEVGILTAGPTSSAFAESLAFTQNASRLFVGKVMDWNSPYGEVHIFDRSGDTFSKVGVVTAPSSADTNDRFGKRLAATPDGQTLVISSSREDILSNDSGNVFIYNNTSGSQYSQIATLSSSNPRDEGFFGSDVSIDDTGSLIVVGSQLENSSGINSTGAAYIFKRRENTFYEVETLTSSSPDSGNFFGRDVLISPDASSIFIGEYAGDIGGTDIGNVHIYDVGISTSIFTTPDGGLSVSGPIEINNSHSIVSKTISHTSTAGISSTIDSFATSANDLAEYTIHVGYGNAIQAQKVLVMHDGTTAYSQEYAVMHNPSKIVTIEASISGNNVLLQATPETGISGITTYKIVRGGLV